ncbi:zinc ribbon domain-containing protein [Blastopirellula marina]|uniref:Uncharacterized protein n=1 Tax=Blastopirellula marina DSM 3645 TaxID=314230 RepID=A4A045_9BACT|nr:zinc ribbon domain-containing protein [Blastopirellula marina]EAQ77831.1 hypothetical protein DSM3645_06004 [Blastopirellula marina DSM 3645]
MFCCECGSKAQGKFCSHCGHPLQADASAPLTEDWEHDVRYEAIVNVAAVRDVIASHAQHAKKGMSAETFLSICDKVIDSPISYAGLAEVVQPMWAKVGVRTGKERAEEIAAPIGRVIARAVCSLAKHGQPILNVQQGDGGCLLTAEFPSSMLAMKGDLRISVVRMEQGAFVGAETDISGQMFDWGKSTNALAQLFADLHSEMGLPASEQKRIAA